LNATEGATVNIDAMKFETLQIDLSYRVAVVWMNREKVRNAFNETVIAELTQAYRVLGADDDVRAIVLAGHGPAFCAGADLDWMRRMSTYSLDDNRRDARGLADMLRTIHDCPKLTIARVHGDAYAGGMGLVAACDIAVGAFNASFSLSETRLGLLPATISPYVMRAIGERACRRYMLTAEKFDASEAFRIGLLHEITPPDELDARINTILGTLMATSDAAVAATKTLIRDVAGKPIDDALAADTAERIARMRASDDGREGIASFLAKRKPRWLVQFEAEQAEAAGTDGDDDDAADPLRRV
jgi:methylglutaconyl-CoA hydratase